MIFQRNDQLCTYMYLGNIMVFVKIWYFMIITVHVAITPNISNNFLYAAYIKAKENKGSILWYIQWTFHVIYKIFKVKSSINMHILLHLNYLQWKFTQCQRDKETERKFTASKSNCISLPLDDSLINWIKLKVFL